MQHALAPGGSVGHGSPQHGKKAIQHVQARRQKQFFLIAVMMGQQPQRHPGPVGNFFERGFRKAVFAKQLFGRLQQRLFFGHGHPARRLYKGIRAGRGRSRASRRRHPPGKTSI